MIIWKGFRRKRLSPDQNISGHFLRGAEENHEYFMIVVVEVVNWHLRNTAT
jgi:hypothetical protein